MLIDYHKLAKKYNIKISGVIHVGGHTGEEVGLYRHYTNNIHIFEPIKECFDYIDTDINKYNVALGSKETELLLNIANNYQSSSFLNFKTHSQEHPEIIFIEQRLVPIRTLDSYLIKNCNLLNIDVQGYELEVLKGGINTLKNIEYIYIEVNNKELYENCAMVDQIDNFLCDFERKETLMTGHGWGDAFYIRKNI